MPINNLEDKDIMVSRLQAAAHVAAAYSYSYGTMAAGMRACWRELDVLLAPINEFINNSKAATSSQTED